MTTEEKLALFVKMQQTEATLHWNRNNFFLVCSSILLLALSQFSKKKYCFAIAIPGLVLNSIWTLIQYRSSQYIDYWKKVSSEIAKEIRDLPDLYPRDLKGLPMRKIAIYLPIVFAALWILIIILTIVR
jgi:hypothetical protein